MKIGERTITAATSQIEGLLREHVMDLNDAFDLTEDVSIGLKVNMTASVQGLRVASEISFVKERVKDKSATATIDENQVTFSVVNGTE